MAKYSSRPSNSFHKFFSFIELLVVVAVIGLLISILLPNLLKARNKTRISVCANNQRMISLALHSYTSDNKHFLPQHQTWGSLLGRQSNVIGGLIRVEDRPLNVYLDNDTEIGICPADNGDAYSERWNPVHESWGSSYLPQWNIDNFATLHVSSNTKPPGLFSFEIPDKKLFLADWPWHMNRELADKRSQWHLSTKRRYNTLFLDGRVSFFTFPTFMQRNTKDDVDLYGWY
ncbi:MAG: type II secretion system GspH family protein [Lentisphaeraceae bacterium]|nr:type II secretion system GspH family protein [Lentisphaeraceae bacterium]